MAALIQAKQRSGEVRDVVKVVMGTEVFWYRRGELIAYDDTCVTGNIVREQEAA